MNTTTTTVTIDDIKHNFGVINTLITDLTESMTIALDNIKDATGELDLDSHTFEALGKAAALCEEMQDLVEQAIDKTMETDEIIFNL